MGDIYTREILRLATSIPFEERLENPDVTVTKTSRICGSRITDDACLENGHITHFGQDVKACAIGQACAAVVGRHVIGMTQDELLPVADAFEAMIKEGAEPQWPDGSWRWPRYR